MKNILKKFHINKPFVHKKFISNLYSFKELNQLLNLRPFLNSKRFNIINSPENGFKWNNQSWLTDVNSFPPSLIKKIIKKYTCFIIDCSRVNKKINDLCKNIEDITKYSTDAHIYFALNKSSKSFDKHKDTSHNFIVQVEGKTTFKVWQNDELVIDQLLTKGDMIYIPKNTYHQAISKEKRLSISFAMSNELNLENQDREWLNI
jgi:mannose-6-phosphate isomerase-like protein (cupin superfamily)